jgi:hypothetical protein
VKAVLRAGGFASEEAAARAINAEPLGNRCQADGYAPHRYRLCREMLNRCRELGRKSYPGASHGDFLHLISTFALGFPPAEGRLVPQHDFPPYLAGSPRHE